jgi:uncharacterized membrane protein YhiD involved in acid resistance
VLFGAGDLVSPAVRVSMLCDLQRFWITACMWVSFGVGDLGLLATLVVLVLFGAGNLLGLLKNSFKFNPFAGSLRDASGSLD